MEIRYICPYWGRQSSTAENFIAKVLSDGYEGIEIDIPWSAQFEKELKETISETREDKDFFFIAQQWLPATIESFEDYKKQFTSRLEHLVSFQPDFINSHTGKDFFSFDQNCMLIETAMNIAMRSGIKILHETHRGRFSFHSASMLPYLEKFPELELVGDFSHWCTVSESLLEDQEEIIEKIIPHISHIHARIGFEHSPQVNDFRAPEWKMHVEQFIRWWQQIIDYHKSKKRSLLTICPEFGPVPYMPVAPYTRLPLADQWDENQAMMKLLKQSLSKQ